MDQSTKNELESIGVKLLQYAVTTGIAYLIRHGHKVRRPKRRQKEQVPYGAHRTD
jgi:hypothetical protein